MDLKHLIFCGVALAALSVSIPACTSESDVPKSAVADKTTESYTDEEVIQIYESRRAAMESQTASGSRVVGGPIIDYLLRMSESEQIQYLLDHPEDLIPCQQELSARYNEEEYDDVEDQCIEYLSCTTSPNDVLKLYEFGSTYGENTDSVNKPVILMSYCSRRPKIIQDIMIDAAVGIDGVQPPILRIEDKSIGGYCEKKISGRNGQLYLRSCINRDCHRCIRT